MKSKEQLTQDADSKIFWVLRQAYTKARNAIATLDKEIGDLKWELNKKQRDLDSAKASEKEVIEHAASLGWTLEMKWEIDNNLKRRGW